MCGFLGVINDSVDEAILNRAASTISYRGTLWGCFKQPGCTLIAVRLPRQGNRNRPQPVQSRLGNLLVFNGEIYNVQALADKLGIKYKRDYIDTEILLLWLEQHGLAGVDELEGEYSLAFISARQDQVFLSRDSFGSHPLYWSRRGKRIAFGSSSRGVSLLASGSTQLDRVSAHDFLWYGVSPAGSIFAHVQSLRPGSSLLINHTGEHLVKRRVSYSQQNPQSIVENLREAVKRRVQSSKSYLSYSGGLDSSLLRTCWPQSAKKSSYKLILHNREKTNNCNNIYLRSSDLLDYLEKYASAAERPLASLSGVGLTMLATHAVADGYENHISGEGADELFHGYVHYYMDSDGHPFLLRRMREKELFESLTGTQAISHSSPQISRLLNNNSPQSWADFDREVRLAEHLCLMNGDLPSMLAGAESRLPFLDLLPFRNTILDKNRPPKDILRKAANYLGIKIPVKRALAIPFRIIDESLLINLAIEIDETEIASIFLNRRVQITVMLRNLQSKLRFNHFPLLTRNLIVEIIARYVVGLWIVKRSLEVPTTINSFIRNSYYSKCRLNSVPRA